MALSKSCVKALQQPSRFRSAVWFVFVAAFSDDMGRSSSSASVQAPLSSRSLPLTSTASMWASRTAVLRGRASTSVLTRP